MLQELSIRNFAIIEDLTIRFDRGLTILSGETGAGKSIIINAVNLLLGSRASAALIRTGADSAELEALFHVPAHSRAAKAMAASGHEPAEGLLVRRIISRSDRHRIYINGRLATIQTLTAIAGHLASISGQHSHQGLFKEEEHLLVLDQFGGLLDLRGEYASQYGRILPLIGKERALLLEQARQGEQMELLGFQHREIEAAGVSIGEDEILEKERRKLKNGELLYQTVHQCVDGLYSGDGAVVEQLGGLGDMMAKAGEIDEQLSAKVGEIQALTYGVEDLAANLRDYLKQINPDPQQLETAEARLDTLNRLKRKYGGSLAAVLDRQAEISRQLDEIETIDEALARVRAELDALHSRLCRLAGTLSTQRASAARQLSAKVERELGALKMPGTRFAVDLQPIPAAKDAGPYLCCDGHGLSETGQDRATFMMAPNVGETIKPLASIASGGELSRVVLALKAILAHNDTLQTVVFDEVDAGIGGAVADGVGQKLANLARHHQVLCITHLPQIAKYGDRHFRIVKGVAKGRTFTTIISLDVEERIEELARMLGGEKITSTTLDHAREMLAAAAR